MKDLKKIVMLGIAGLCLSVQVAAAGNNSSSSNNTRNAAASSNTAAASRNATTTSRYTADAAAPCAGTDCATTKVAGIDNAGFSALLSKENQVKFAAATPEQQAAAVKAFNDCAADAACKDANKAFEGAMTPEATKKRNNARNAASPSNARSNATTPSSSNRSGR